ncbi:FecR family protein [Membranihabitans maritimus]|uniref:FecR family protein n=1 Tax=Membranihabitans maritimus TaxID=2904244 RepID=UPI001F1EAC4A|nr:FecR family protein [Membranihabitans maritimus]
MKREIQLLLQKYLENRCTEEELDQLFSYMANLSPHEAEETTRKLWNSTQFVPSSGSELEIFKQNILHKIQSNDNENFRSKKQKSHITLFITTAACIAVIITFFFLVYLPKGTNPITIGTLASEHKEIKLPDNTIVTLNENSQISYSPGFSSQDIRTVELKGEAYFNVTKDKKNNKHFQVKTQGLTIDVLGTIFNVKSDEKMTRIFLEEGSIRLKMENNSQLLMQPGEVVTYSNEENKILSSEETKPLVETSWKDNIIFFDKLPLREVISEVEKMYDVNLVFEQLPKLEKKINAGIPKNDLETTIKSLEKILGTNIKIKDMK